MRFLYGCPQTLVYYVCAAFFPAIIMNITEEKIMFFGNNESETPNQPLRLTVVTDEYIIEAWDDPGLSVFAAAFDANIDGPSAGNIRLYRN